MFYVRELTVIFIVGKLTQKYQARLAGITENVRQLSEFDTIEMSNVIGQYSGFNPEKSPSSYPQTGEIMPIDEA